MGIGRAFCGVGCVPSHRVISCLKSGNVPSVEDVSVGNSARMFLRLSRRDGSGGFRGAIKNQLELVDGIGAGGSLHVIWNNVN